MPTFWPYARRMFRYRWMVAGAIGMAFLSAGGLGVGLLGLKPILENVLGAQKDLPAFARDLNAHRVVAGRIPESVIETLPQGPFTAVVWIMVGLAILTILGATANFLHAFLSLTVVNRTTANIRREVFHKVLRLPLKDVVASGPSDTISRIVNDTNTLAVGFNALLSRALAHVTKGMVGVIVAFIYDWRLALGALLVAPLLATTIRKLGKRIRRASRKALDSQAGLYGAAAEALQGLRVVKVHTTERYEAGRFHRINKEVLRQMNRARTARALSSPLVEVMTVLSLGMLVLIAARVVIMQQLDPSSLIATLLALGITGASLKPLTGVLNDIQAASAAGDRLNELFSRAPEGGHDPRLPKLPRHRDSIVFRNVSFTYPGATTPSLDGVDLRIGHGERIAIVGPNGSGKTTLLALVPRLFDPDAPPAGIKGDQTPAILIDGCDIRTVSIRSLRRQIGVVTQETVLFQTTIRANIAYGAENASDQAVTEAARRARADEFIDTLPLRYETPVGEQGATLSGGQRQRISIARAILRKPSILILDEATSMIDADSEAKITEAIAEFSSGPPPCTCLIVAHRLSTVVNADRIVVMDHGRIIDQGTHDELLERCPTYRLIAEHQLVRHSATV